MTGRRWLWRVVVAAVVLAVVILLVQGANRPADPSLGPPPDGRRPLDGFGETAFAVTGAAGTPAEWCALLAEDLGARQQGLMHQSDLRGYDAMVFRFPAPTEGAFHMRGTTIPLTVAFFDGDGRFVSSADMQPCPDDVADCPTYDADRPYLHALEVPRGGLDELGITATSVLSFPPGSCPG